jgi:hypothetical protein
MNFGVPHDTTRDPKGLARVEVVQNLETAVAQNAIHILVALFNYLVQATFGFLSLCVLKEGQACSVYFRVWALWVDGGLDRADGFDATENLHPTFTSCLLEFSLALLKPAPLRYRLVMLTLLLG